jgi:hypothetical protein
VLISQEINNLLTRLAVRPLWLRPDPKGRGGCGAIFYQSSFGIYMINIHLRESMAPPAVDCKGAQIPQKKLLTEDQTRYTFRIAIQMGRLRSAVVRAHSSFPASY